ncbi:MAG TPA: hypothetical protein VMR97_09445 [Acidimicrobiales bacterium]|nr:hypothetical protein [Acidimicrobiales bacterium]
MSYQVLYRTDTTSNNQDVTQWELLTVDRPFDSSDVTYSQYPSASEMPVSGYVSTEQALYDVNAGEVQFASGKQPGVPAGDQDLVTQMPEMLARGLAVDTGSNLDVAGHQCHVYRLYEPPVGAIKPLGGSGDHDDVCLEPNGIILSEAWTYHAHLVYSRRALEVTLTKEPLPSLSGDTSAGSPLAPSVTPESSPTSFLAPPPAPPGFRAEGAYDFAIPNEQDPSLLQASSVVWAFVKGPDVTTVEAGSMAGGALPWQGESTVVEAAELPGFVHAQSAIRSDGAEIRIDAGHGEWVRVRSTMPVSWLVRYAGSLRMAR